MVLTQAPHPYCSGHGVYIRPQECSPVRPMSFVSPDGTDTACLWRFSVSDRGKLKRRETARAIPMLVCVSTLYSPALPQSRKSVWHAADVVFFPVVTPYRMPCA